MNDHVPTWILKDQEESEKNREGYYAYMARKLKEMDKETPRYLSGTISEMSPEERQASKERDKVNNDDN